MSTESDDEKVFKALANHRRRGLLDCLKAGPKTTGALCGQFPDMDRCTVMQHLAALEDAELIIVKRDGRERWNHLNAMPIKRIHDRWISEYASHAMNLLDRLKSDLEGAPNPSAG